MGSKIRPPGTSMGPFFSKTWYFDGSIFQHFLKFAPKWRKFGTLIGQLFKIFRNLPQNGANFSEKFWFLVHGWVTFPSKWVHGWVAFQKSQRHTPTQTKVEYPPPGPFSCFTRWLLIYFGKSSNMKLFSQRDFSRTSVINTGLVCKYFKCIFYSEFIFFLFF